MSTIAQTRMAYSEIDELISLFSEEERNRIPRKLRQFFKDEKDQTYAKHIDANVPIKDQNLMQETIDLVAFLNLRYICQDEDEKKRLQAIYQANEERYQEELREKYNPDNIFKNREEVIENNTEEIPQEETVQMTEYKESFIQKIISKLKSIFKRG